MSFAFDKLCPYQSLILAKMAPDAQVRGLLAAILTDMEDALDLTTPDRQLISTGEPLTEGNLQIAGLHYIVRTPASWTLNPEVIDVTNHLALVFRRGRAIAIHLSENSFRNAVVKQLDRPKFAGLGKVEPISASMLNAAFVDGPAKTLWLGGIHKSTSVKADAKTLSGTNLRDALDPLGDQTYYVRAARSQVETDNFKNTVGVSPRNSRIWMTFSRDWETCKGAVEATLDHLMSITKGIDEPLPFVAVAAKTLDALGTAYEMAIIPPQLLSDDPSTDAETLKQFEFLSENTSFEIEKSEGPEITALVSLGEVVLGRVSFCLKPRSRGRIGIELVKIDDNDQLVEIFQHCRRDDWLRIWFDSGDTFTNAGVYHVRFRDYPFENFEWDDFAKYDVTKEKPSTPFDPDLIGKSDSLFCWTLHNFSVDGDPGWLVCDDGGMELADFIHLSGDTVTLIHAKGAQSKNANRRISVSSYEVVASQALKSLRWLDNIHLAKGLTDGLDRIVGEAVWHNRKLSSRKEFLAALAKLGSRFKRRVVILQPQVTKANLKRGEDAVEGHELTRYRQLMTLLNATRTACQGLGAELWVVGQNVVQKEIVKRRVATK